MPDSSMGRLGHEKTYAPSIDAMLKISLGLVLFAILTTVLVYAETVTTSAGGESYDIEYTGDGVTVAKVDAYMETTSLIFDVSVPDDTGTLVVTFDRTFFDETCGGLDGEFIVLVDGDFPDFQETETTAQSRTLSISLHAGSTEVEILGSVLAGADLCEDGGPEPPATVQTPDPTPEPPKTDKAQCGPGTVLVDGKCELEKKCGPGTTLVDGKCELEKKCGPGTILVDGKCELDKTCGPGTILVDGKCELSKPASAPFSLKSLGKDLGVGFFAAFAAAGVLGIILGLVARSHRNKN
ncbi:MAG: hypothetical protein EB830_06285 [Nitrosopumilus sp. H13]|nr:MAG: hypothetical protein EB830_06285 [Nitrosopumilus sp. H13]